MNQRLMIILRKQYCNKRNQTSLLKRISHCMIKGDLDGEATQANQLNSAEDCSEMVKDVVLTKEVSKN